MEEHERERFYSSDAADDEPDEYELEPPDEEVLASEERRNKEALESSLAAIDIDAVYREADRDVGSELLEGWLQRARTGFRFRIRHVLLVTAVLAIVLALYHHGMLGTTLIVLIMGSVAGLYFYVRWHENKHQAEAERRRQALYEERRRKLQRGPTTMYDADVEPPGAGEPAASVPKTARSSGVAIQFSLLQLMCVMTGAAILLGVLQLLGGASTTATALGSLALVGLVVYATGFEPPALVVLGWWLLLVVYIARSIGAMLWSSLS